MRALMLGFLGGLVPRFGGVDGGRVPGSCGVEVLEDVPLREFEGSVEGFEGGVRLCILFGLAGSGLGLVFAAPAAPVSFCFGEGVSVVSRVAHSGSEVFDSAWEEALVVDWRSGILNWDSLGSFMSSLVAPIRAILIEIARPCPCSLRNC